MATTHGRKLLKILSTDRNGADQGAAPPRRDQAPTGERPAVSYLVRFWLEPCEHEGEAAFRGYARDLRTGEERYVADPRRLAEHILRQLHAARKEQAGLSEPEQAEAMSG